MQRLQALLEKRSRIVIGLMSGTSLDGVDVAVARLEGTVSDLKIELIGHAAFPYPEELRASLLQNSGLDSSSVIDLSQLNMRLAFEYDKAVRGAVKKAGLSLADVDLVGSHGQTVHHVPERTECAGVQTISTLQIGDPSALANLLDVPVVGDFRVADMALGGQGAPLVPYFDFVYFRSADESRGLLNLGGIANLSVIPAGAEIDDVFAFDTGPANMVMDSLARILFDEPFDESGRHASGGSFDDSMMAELLRDPYFQQEPPKSTGREYFGTPYAERLVTRCQEVMRNPKPNDILATASMLTVFSVYQAYARYVRDRQEIDVLLVSGGGMHNVYLMDRLKNTFAPIPVRTVEDYGLNSDAKEALCFAVLAHEAINGAPTNIPSVTGASRKTVLGKICVPA